MASRAHVWIFAVTALALAGCGGDDGGFSLPPADTEPVRPSSIEVTDTDASITDVLTVGVIDGFGPNGSELVELLPPPHAFGEFTLLQVTVDDPNGTGRVDGRWYPPRIRRAECSTSVDSAPTPIASAGYVPGDPEHVFSGSSLSSAEQVFGNDEQVTITVQLFDEAAQRDAMLDVLDEQYRTGMQVDCGVMGGEQDLAEVTAWPPLSGQPLSSVFELSMIGFSGHLALVPIGDRVLLQVGVGEGIGGGGGATPDRDDLQAVAALAIARIEGATLP